MIEAPDAPTNAADESGAAPSVRATRRPWLPAVAWRAEAGWLASAEVFTIAALAVVLEAWRGRVRVPLLYSGSDSNLVMMSIRNIIETGWMNNSDRLGAPFGQQLYDYPAAAGDALHLLLLKLLGIVSQDPALVMNAFFGLGFLLTTATAFVSMRLLGASRPMSAAGAVLFSFVPYHLLRGQAHLMLASYYGVPFAVLLVVRQWGDTPLIDFSRRTPWREVATSARTWGAVGICLLVGTTGLYYAVFTVFLLAIAAVVRGITARSFRPALAAVLLTAVIGLPIVLSTMPNRIYVWTHGPNPQVAGRGYAETEFYGLHISNLVLPVGGHRLAPLADLRAETNASPVPGEGSETLGLFGAAGFVGLVLVGLRRLGGGRDDDDQLSPLSGVVIAMVLLTTVAGFSAVVAALGFTQIRAWNRGSVVIAFAAITAVAIWTDRLVSRLGARIPLPIAVVAAIVAVVGVVDQTTTAMVPPYDQTRRSWNLDRAFVAGVERDFGDADVFQLPYVPFPENPPVVSMVDYEHLRGYLHSERLRWSYGGMKGRETEWQPRLLASQPREEWPELLALAGFEALWVDRAGYEDRGLALEASLRSDTGDPRAVGGDGRFAVYDLRPLQQRLGAIPAGVREAAREAVLHPVGVSFVGTHGEENGADGPYRWMPSTAQIKLTNDGDTVRPLRIEFNVDAVGHPLTGMLQIRGAGIDRSVSLALPSEKVVLDVKVPPGESSLALATTTHRVPSEVDPRDLRLRIAGLRTTEPALDVELAS